ncbi:MAG: zinc metallopeptidase [Bacilli bacterium]|nr:zinc metallopeptidase [Bacilli bacterium]
MYDLILYGLTFVAFIITSLAQAYITSTYKKYSLVKNGNGMTGREVARKILDNNGLKNVDVVEVSGYLSDHYDPSSKVVRLSNSNYSESSISAVSVAAHECGHAIQDKDNYLFLRFRASLVPIVNFSSYAGYLAIVIGGFTGIFELIKLGILLECVILLFQVVTLPVEIDASKRALSEVKRYKYLSEEEYGSGKSVLIAAALTYVAGVASALIQILRLVLVYGRREKK